MMTKKQMTSLHWLFFSDDIYKRFPVSQTFNIFLEKTDEFL